MFDFKRIFMSTYLSLEFAYNNNYHPSTKMAPYLSHYMRIYISFIVLVKVCKARLIGPYLVHKAMDKKKVIQETLKMAQSLQKSNKNVKRRLLEFEVDDLVFFMISQIKGVICFCNKGKLLPLYIQPYQIPKRIGNVAYESELPQVLASVHPVIHISMLKKCMVDNS